MSARAATLTHRLALFLAALPTVPQSEETTPPTPFDRVFELELAPDDESLIEGRGPTLVVELELEFSGTLHLWTRSELDLFLRVEDPLTGSSLAEDGDAGGGRTPRVELPVEAGDFLVVLLASPSDAQLGPLALHVRSAPESEATRAAVEEGRARLERARRLHREGQVREARAEAAELVSGLLETPGAEHSELVCDLLWGASALARQVGEVSAARAAQALLRGHIGRTLPPGHPTLLEARMKLAVAFHKIGDVDQARALYREVLAGYELSLAADHPAWIPVRANLAITMRELGDLAGARALEEWVLEARERTLPVDHPDTLTARLNLSVTLNELGEIHAARRLEEDVLASYERSFPEDHQKPLRARFNVATSRHEMGDLVGARELYESVLVGFERTLPADHITLITVRGNLAAALRDLGQLAAARELEERALASCERTLFEEHPVYLGAQLNLANTLKQLGDLASARTLEEGVVATRERTLPADHPDLLTSRGNLAGTMSEMGDFAGARALNEVVLAGCERTLPEDHHKLLLARSNLSIAMLETGDLEGALELHESVLASYARTLPAYHPRLLRAGSTQAIMLAEAGELEGALELHESLLSDYEPALPEDHPDLLLARMNLAGLRVLAEDLPGARAIFESVLASYERTLPPEHPRVSMARMGLAVTLRDQGDLSGCLALVPAQATGMSRRVMSSLALAPRQARAAVERETERLAELLHWTRTADGDLRELVFELQETMRMVAGESARALRGARDPEVRALLEQAALVRRALNDLMSGALAENDPGRLSSELTDLLGERDRLERQASRTLAERGVVTRPIEVRDLLEALGEEAALVAYRIVPAEEHASPRLQVHVLAKSGALVRRDLGGSVELAELVAAWRPARGPSGLRGVAPGESDPSSGSTRLGEQLRERLLDPVLELLGEETRRLHVCADDFLFLLPLDALPYDDGFVGDRWTIVNEVSCARLVARPGAGSLGSGLLAVGGVAYDGADAAEEPSQGRRAGPRFSKLPQTVLEARAIGEAFADHFGSDPELLLGERATTEALRDSVSGVRYLHMATHGWFAPEGVRSTRDETPEDREWSPMDVRERVTGMAPMLLCGLALAGANDPPDALGRRSGILTAEELCSLDLSACELAVLSACETNVGIRRAGQGIQSLQAALYAAGARSSITSLWKVDDAATRRLMELFYANLWGEQLPMAEALWGAKRVLRDEGAAVRDWAGWVLTGDPE